MEGLDERVVFVVGIHRSGANWLAGLLSSHPDAIRVTPESLGWSTQGRTLETAICADAYSTEIVRDMFGGLPEDKVLVEKSVPHIFHLDRLREIFPGCKVINIRRDPRDVIWSMMSSDWPRGLFPMDLPEAVEYFMKYYRAERRYTAWTRVVHYADLVKNPVVEVLQLFLAAGLDAGPLHVHGCIKAAARGGAYPERLRGYVRTGKVGEGVRNLSRSVQDMIALSVALVDDGEEAAK